MPEHRIDITSIDLKAVLAMNGTDFNAEKIKDIDERTVGVYIFYQTSPLQQIWYVGASQNLRDRIKHHTFAKFFRLLIKAGCSIKVAFIEYPDQTKEELIAIESVFIRRLIPVLNLQHNQFLRQLKSVKTDVDYQVKSDPLVNSSKTVLSILSRRGVKQQQTIDHPDEEKIRHLLENLTIRELKKIASYCDVIGYSNMTKLELAIAIKDSEKLTDDQLLQPGLESF